MTNSIPEPYLRLHDIISDCIEGGRLTGDALPDDYQAIVDTLIACNAQEDQSND